MDKVILHPYLFFAGNCREAMEFYKNIFGGELTIQAFDDIPGDTPEDMKGKIMHARLSGGDVELMASDSQAASPEARKIELSLSGMDEAKLSKIFDGLSAGGKVKSSLKKEFWGDIFGSLTDKYNIDWMVNIISKKD
jgi:PhnB protein